ncbi:23S rRNA (guanosine2251-2'-O)-methyltransferase [Clostridium cadaveris]|uniref:23S rRNA (Guanosine2251-2'-O)-methyltransferase n=2 Tax=Clostridium cadaveris TaxID=1529 RepID=A0A1I2PXM5_9CLOT|nr:23S rRNA (guanosine(2251)-2'-O)-methyltransferase RlmB [Clostridium cadaveris]MDM8311199.1 23S rRNA (guanosine(2251)-2'-O)-methyltransferase RlmB [Clostridium cadaveris]UFH64685.1 23S rRNA (guanosine(2251)-2'-O)-methyltransferase RlmB [Clostridium cadaveris]SFG20804.1 23S rRNA (guanosine2251-2'-O)-methyltransferase [Clostridium cadaveris]
MAKINRNSSKNSNKSKNNISNKQPKKVVAEPMREDIVLGRNGVIEALKAKITVEQILISKGEKEGSIVKIMALAKEKGVVIKEVDRKKLDSLSQGEAHQGVVAMVTPFRYSEIQDILDRAKEREESPFIIILDEIEDPHNLGSIIRTAELCGAHGIIIPKRRNVGVTPTVYKTSAGAVNYMKIAKVSNINNTIDELKKENIWVYGADGEAENFSYNVDFKGAVALVIGSEGRGISKLTREKCDVMVKIPMVGKVNSLNASVAGGILMYEVLKSRL